MLKETLNQNKSTKGQLTSKWVLWVVHFLQKTNENKSTWSIIVVKFNLFVRFLEEIDDPKNHFEINWPLENQKWFQVWFTKTLSSSAPLFCPLEFLRNTNFR